MTKNKIIIIIIVVAIITLIYKIRPSYGLVDDTTSSTYNQESVVGDIKKSNAYKIYADFLEEWTTHQIKTLLYQD